MERKIPKRMCVGCREMRAKKDLIRVVRTAEEGVPKVDRTGRANGRGAYICPDTDCLKKAAKTRALERALEVKITPEILDQLEREIERREL